MGENALQPLETAGHLRIEQLIAYHTMLGHAQLVQDLQTLVDHYNDRARVHAEVEARKMPQTGPIPQTLELRVLDWVRISNFIHPNRPPLTAGWYPVLVRLRDNPGDVTADAMYFHGLGEGKGFNPRERRPLTRLGIDLIRRYSHSYLPALCSDREEAVAMAFRMSYLDSAVLQIRKS